MCGYLLTRGSSPLARGLRTHERQLHIRVRIIPARAGFTKIDSLTSGVVGDHPRSRGVYDPLHVVLVVDGGSSPLARGLRDRDACPLHGRRIIPARAGFTPRGPSPCSASPDHPRSRGVYSDTLSANALKSGSSPLARGLPWNPYETASGTRIIPARAGFTHPSRGQSSPGTDHPRSRGVYGDDLLSAWTSAGSSPLARGLRG